MNDPLNDTLAPAADAAGRILLAGLFLYEAYVKLHAYGPAVQYAAAFGVPSVLLPAEYLLKLHPMDPQGVRLFGAREVAVTVRGQTRELGAVRTVSATELALRTDDLDAVRSLRRVVAASTSLTVPARRPRDLLETSVQQRLADVGRAHRVDDERHRQAGGSRGALGGGARGTTGRAGRFGGGETGQVDGAEHAHSSSAFLGPQPGCFYGLGLSLS